jgi:hypothetical protein
MKISTDNKELVLTYLLTAVEGFKVLLACMLVVFVPQACDNPDGKGTHTCTFDENFSNLTDYNAFVLAWNFFTLLGVVRFYWVQSKRETYFITHLEVNKDIADNGLGTSLERYEKIKSRVGDHNRLLFSWTGISLIMFLMNAIFSAVLIFGFYYDGFRSVTALLTNVMLVIGRLFSVLDISYNCVNHKCLALSAVRSEPISFNDVDNDYKSST